MERGEDLKDGPESSRQSDTNTRYMLVVYEFRNMLFQEKRYTERENVNSAGM